MIVHCEWGLTGAQSLIDQADVFIVVDVLSFSTCVDIACARGAKVYPFPIGNREASEREAQRLQAIVAGNRSDPNAVYSLSAPTLQDIPLGARLVLPSPNGSKISFSTKGKPMLAGCLRNAAAVAELAAGIAEEGTVGVIPAGECWNDGSLRPAIEDLLGAGAIIAELSGRLSSEAIVAREAFVSAAPELLDRLLSSVSGIELTDRGFPQDVEIAAELNVSACAPIVIEEAYTKAK